MNLLGCVCLQSFKKVLKSAKRTLPFFSSEIKYRYKNAEFNADFEFFEKVGKNHAKKIISKKGTGNWSFRLLLVFSLNYF